VADTFLRIVVIICSFAGTVVLSVCLGLVFRPDDSSVTTYGLLKLVLLGLTLFLVGGLLLYQLP
jgi:hypothetical protein